MSYDDLVCNTMWLYGFVLLYIHVQTSYNVKLSSTLGPSLHRTPNSKNKLWKNPFKFLGRYSLTNMDPNQFLILVLPAFLSISGKLNLRLILYLMALHVKSPYCGKYALEFAWTSLPLPFCKINQFNSTLIRHCKYYWKFHYMRIGITRQLSIINHLFEHYIKNRLVCGEFM